MQKLSDCIQLYTVYKKHTLFTLYYVLAASWHMGSQFLNWRWNPCSLQWKCGVLTTELLGKSLRHILSSNIRIHQRCKYGKKQEEAGVAILITEQILKQRMNTCTPVSGYTNNRIDFTRVHPWWIHVDVWQNQYNAVISLQLNKFIVKKTMLLEIKRDTLW